ncbi:ABC transporter permease subunit [Desertibacillus haloalkaliphilus]|uniref:ABC transporter permease subunit n=1 Tax=Desertibacillus haloalkaliphilus TaxID=1328930 RepID=UPI001C27956D|nr:ABC transporter permease subunit [Desertibacillus haloalkaliphilus]MBU8908332.1 ABC transporter permease [Desertibacillus haloalkaliphilus]
MTTYLIKEWKEQSRGKGLWLGLGIIILVSIFILIEARNYPTEQSFEVFLVSLYEMNVYLLPLLCLFLASFTIMQEKELKTLMILMTKKESYRSFLLKKSVAVHGVMLALFVGWYFLLAIPMKFLLPFETSSFLTFLVSVIIFIVIFNQVGVFLGSICSSRMQVVGACVFVWFLFVFLADLVYLYFLPAVTLDNVLIFSILFFLHPLHAIRIYLENSIGIFSLEYMSRLMEKMIWLSPVMFVMLNIIIWTIVSFELAVRLKRKGVRA